jgi:hypothetical protein
MPGSLVPQAKFGMNLRQTTESLQNAPDQTLLHELSLHGNFHWPVNIAYSKNLQYLLFSEASVGTNLKIELRS